MWFPLSPVDSNWITHSETRMSGYVHGFGLKNGLHVEVQPPDSSEVRFEEPISARNNMAVFLVGRAVF
jgi:hypothetical protein